MRANSRGRAGDTRVEGSGGRESDDEPDPLIGQLIADRFQVVSPIARGGMGRVYRAVQQPLGRDIAFKVLDVRNATAKRSDFHRRFFLEASIASRLNHPNTVVVFDHGQWGEDLYFIAMELIEGRTLLAALRAEGPFDPVRTVHVGRQLCGSLADAHAKGIVHRDLKPSNVMLTRRGNDPDFVKVVDFGLVKVLGPEEELDLTQSGVMVGSPRYMAPEQVLGRQVDTKADIYSLGAMLYHVVTGKPPFDGESKFEVLQAQVNQPPPPIRETYPWCPASKELEAIIMRCLEKKPADRFPSMDELGGALAMVNPTRGDTAMIQAPPHDLVPVPDVVSMAMAMPSGESTPFLAPPPRELRAAPAPRWTTSVVLIGAAVAALVMAGGAAWSMLRPRIDEDVVVVEPGAATAGSQTRSTVGVPTPPTVAAAPDTATPAEPARVRGSRAGATVRLVTDPVGAHVWRDGIDLGDAPLNLMIPTGERWTLEISAPGREPRTIVAASGQGELRVALEQSPSESDLGPGPGMPRQPPRAPGTRPPRDHSTDNRDPWAAP